MLSGQSRYDFAVGADEAAIGRAETSQITKQVS